MKRMKERVKLYPSRYQQKGQITVNGCDISITRKELIEAGLDPKMFGWRPLERENPVEKKEQGIVTSKSIAHASMELPKRAIESVKSLFTREKDDKHNVR